MSLFSQTLILISQVIVALLLILAESTEIGNDTDYRYNDTTDSSSAKIRLNRSDMLTDMSDCFLESLQGGFALGPNLRDTYACQG